MTINVFNADCLEWLRQQPNNSIDSIVTDPPYGLSNTKPAQVADVLAAWVTGDTEAVPATKGGFMGKDWDSFVPPPAVWVECMRVLKPGGHMAVFAGARTQDLMGLSIRLAGFEIRDTLGWIYGSGFPKNMDIGKAIDKRGGNAHLAKEIGKAIQEARESRGLTKGWCDERFCGGTTNWSWFEGRPTGIRPPSIETFKDIVSEWPELGVYAEKVAEAEREVVGKSSHKSGIGNATQGHYTVGGTKAEAYNITAPATPEAQRWDGWGTALKPAIEPIILARKPLDGTVASNVLAHGVGGLNIDACRVPSGEPAPAGRFPANVLLDEHAAKEMDKQSGVLKSGAHKAGQPRNAKSKSSYTLNGITTYEDAGSVGGASRFFPVFKYNAKAPKRERPVIVREDGSKIQHPTVKPEKLMSWLVELITPPGGTVLDPFAGSGTTLQAARNKGFNAIGIEAEKDYIELINQRLNESEK
ncbi:site-specific DNA-methyltransferase [Corynebacterium phoceense]|uniref:DNA methyltransferase n=1 Tax=Corynebacterium phoceense TaxID=1686286 RepID=UPI00211CA1AF|nr:DNA methyltransferase [Corynebacterium phoceense]MCQ9340822.1 site-specific DNA-methyltransferase [Corynebacterium phoceense]